MNNLFDHQVAMPKFEMILKHLAFAESVEVQSVKIEEGCAEWVSREEEANAFGVYLRYNKHAIDILNMNPSEWIADFDTLKGATNFQLFITELIKLKGTVSTVINYSV